MLTLIEPLITETTIAQAGKRWYTFSSPIDQTKPKLRELIEKNFKVHVLEIKTMRVKGKTKRSPRSRRLIQGSSWKKVMVKVKEGEKIDLFETGA